MQTLALNAADLEEPTAVDTDLLRKARGAFFTPDQLTRYICRWALQSTSDRVLEPSCGEAAFLLAATKRLDEMRAPVVPDQLVGVELHEASAATARSVIAATGRPVRVRTGDFFTLPGERSFDVVIGNPPYVRYQDFAGAARASSRGAALSGGVSLTALASSWAAFTIHSAEFLRPGGRLGLVLPAELLTVNYASEVRRYLMRSFGRVRLILFTERVFPGVMEEVVLLLAEDAGRPDGTDRCELYQLQSASELSKGLEGVEPQIWLPGEGTQKWTHALLSFNARADYNNLLNTKSFANLKTWGKTSLGAVTGANKYFALNPAQVERIGLRTDEVLPLSPPGSRHLRGLSFSTQKWRGLGGEGAPTLLFRPSADWSELSPGARAYVQLGEQMRINEAYKCRVRKPWWRVPLVDIPDVFITYMNADTPRLTTNSAKVRHLNSVHGLYIDPLNRSIGRELLPLASLNTVTLLGAELVGRAYGGGMLKLEPGEADELPVPSPTVIEEVATRLRRQRASILRHLRSGRLRTAVMVVDEIVLLERLGVSSEELHNLREAHQMLADRRAARGVAARTGA